MVKQYISASSAGNVHSTKLKLSRLLEMFAGFHFALPNLRITKVTDRDRDKYQRHPQQKTPSS